VRSCGVRMCVQNALYGFPRRTVPGANRSEEGHGDLGREGYGKVMFDRAGAVGHERRGQAFTVASATTSGSETVPLDPGRLHRGERSRSRSVARVLAPIQREKG
jgi:hypothetical protein